MEITRYEIEAQTANGGKRAFGATVVPCPDCEHGIDPHGTDPGGQCGVGGCQCLMQPNGIASWHIAEAQR
jgi:hypothetical protein